MRLTFLVVTTVMLSACASAAGSADSRAGSTSAPARISETSAGMDITVRNEVTVARADVNASAARVWAALPAAYAALGIPVMHNDPATHTIGNLQLRARRTLAGKSMDTFFRCSSAGLSGPIENRYTLQISLRTQVVATGATSRLDTTAEAYAKSNEGTSSTANSTIPCTSTGKLEQAIADATLTRLGAS